MTIPIKLVYSKSSFLWRFPHGEKSVKANIDKYWIVISKIIIIIKRFFGIFYCMEGKVHGETKVYNFF